MSLHEFVTHLTEQGHVSVARETPPEAFDVADLESLDAAARLELPGTPPALDLDVAQWAFKLLYEACRAYVYREIPAEDMQQQLAEPCPKPKTASTCYSADLALRYLPDLLALAQRLAAADPLVDRLRALAVEWPLSSVGVAGLEGVDPSPFLDDPCLRRLYVDRILAKTDSSRVAHPRVAAAVREALGVHVDLGGSIAEMLENTDG